MSWFLIFCITFVVVLFSRGLPAGPPPGGFELARRTRTSRDATNPLHLWGFLHAPPYLGAPPAPRFPSFVCVSFWPTARSGMKVEEKGKKNPEAESEEGGVNRFSRYTRPTLAGLVVTVISDAHARFYPFPAFQTSTCASY